MTELARLFAAAPLLLGLTGACSVHGSGVPKTDPRTTSGFEDIELASFVDAKITVGKPSSVAVHCDENLVQYIRTEVRGGTLVVETRGASNIDPTGSCLVEIGLPKLVSLSISGSGDASVRGAAEGLKRVAISGSSDVTFDDVKSDRLAMNVSGAGNVRIDRLASKSLDVQVSGAGDVKVSGSSERVDVHTSGAGNVDARAVAAQDANVHISGAGDVEVAAARSVGVSISGVGNATVRGNPPQRKVEVSGIGNVDFE